MNYSVENKDLYHCVWRNGHWNAALMLLYEMLYLPAAASDKSGNFPSNNDISRKRSCSACTPNPAWHTKGPGMSCKGLNWNQAFQWECEPVWISAREHGPILAPLQREGRKKDRKKKSEHPWLQLWHWENPRRLGGLQCPCLPRLTTQQANSCCKVIRLTKPT